MDQAADGRDGLFMAAANDYDVLIIDRMLPSLDGLSILRTLRGSGDRTPVLILSALGDVDDRVDGLRAGGDDYLVKPYAFAELGMHAGEVVRILCFERNGTIMYVLEQIPDLSDVGVFVHDRQIIRGEH